MWSGKKPTIPFEVKPKRETSNPKFLYPRELSLLKLALFSQCWSKSGKEWAFLKAAAAHWSISYCSWNTLDIPWYGAVEQRLGHTHLPNIPCWFLYSLSPICTFVCFPQGHSGAGTISYHHHLLLQRCHGNHASIWHHQCQELWKHQQVAQKHRWGE